MDGLDALGGDAEGAFGAASPLGLGVGDGGGDEAFGFETVEGGVDGSDGDVAAGAVGDFASDAHAVGVVVETEDSEEDEVFEFSEGITLGHDFYIVEKVSEGVKEEFGSFLQFCGVVCEAWVGMAWGWRGTV